MSLQLGAAVGELIHGHHLWSGPYLPISTAGPLLWCGKGPKPGGTLLLPLLQRKKFSLPPTPLGEISITSDMQMTPPLLAESEEELKSLLMKVKEEE